MNLLRKRSTKVKQETAVTKISDEVLHNVLLYVTRMSLPAKEEEIDVCLRRTLAARKKADSSDREMHYLLIYASPDAAGRLNAGYAAGQAAAYLHFQGIDAKIIREVPEHIRKERQEGRVCTVVLAFGRKWNREKAEKRQSEEERCVYCGLRENWAEKVLALAGRGRKEGNFPHLLTVQVLNCGSHIYVAPKSAGNKWQSAAELETGIAAAELMSAGEEMWVDLAVFTPAGHRGAVCVCRRQDLEAVMTGSASVEGQPGGTFEKNGIASTLPEVMREQDKPTALKNSVWKRKAAKSWYLRLLRGSFQPNS